VIVAAEVATHVGLWRDYVSTLTDPAHLLTELTIEVATGLVGAVVGVVAGRGWLRRHDRAKHSMTEERIRAIAWQEAEKAVKAAKTGGMNPPPFEPERTWVS
jgi:hypothetical protein